MTDAAVMFTLVILPGSRIKFIISSQPRSGLAVISTDNTDLKLERYLADRLIGDRFGVASADLYPRFGLAGSIGLSGEDFSDQIESGSESGFLRDQ